MRILVVEDEADLAESIAEGLTIDGYSVDVALDGKEAYELAFVEEYDLILLDLNLPGMDGLEILQELRKEKKETKVLILTARTQIGDRVAGLDLGADDYLTKPFSFDELEARIRCLLRRKYIQQDTLLQCADLSFDTLSRTAFAGGNALVLTRKETALFEYFIMNAGKVISSEELLEHVWDGSVDSFSNAVRVHIYSLRKKIRSEIGYDPIESRIGEGYRLVKEGKAGV